MQRWDGKETLLPGAAKLTRSLSRKFIDSKSNCKSETRENVGPLLTGTKNMEKAKVVDAFFSSGLTEYLPLGIPGLWGLWENPEQGRLMLGGGGSG